MVVQKWDRRDHMGKLSNLDKDTVAKLVPGKWWYRGKVAGRETPRGFGVRVLAGENGEATTRSYVLRYKVGGKERLHRLGQTTDMSAGDAVKAALDLRKLVNRGEDPVGEKHKAKAAAKADEANKFEKVCERFFASSHVKQLRSAAKHESDMKRLVYPVFGERDITTIKRSEIAALRNTIDAKCGPSMAAKALANMRTIFNWFAADSDDYNSPIVRGMVKTSIIKRKRQRILFDEELVAAWKAAEGTYGALIKFILLTGCRPAEAQKMPWTEIKGNLWTLPAARNKTKVDLIRPLSDAALAVLPPRHGAYVFPSPWSADEPIGNVNRPHQDLKSRSATDGWHRHDLRRTARSLMPRAGVPKEHAEQCLGHLLPGVEGIYNVYDYFNEKREAYVKLACLIDSLVDPQSNVVQLKTAASRQGAQAIA